MKNFMESIADIFRHRLTSLLFCSVIAITIFILSIFGSVIYNLNGIQSKWSHEVRIMVFTSDTADQKLIIDQIKKINGIADVINIEPPVVGELIKKRFPDQNIDVSDTVLPSLIEVKTGIKDVDEIKKELGDLLLHIVFYSKIASETNAFNINDVIESINKKLKILQSL